MVSRRKFLGNTIMGAFAAVGMHRCAEPSRTFDHSPSYEPHEVQLDFMRLVAAKVDYLALGDTDHRRSELALFALNAKTVRALQSGGKTNYFLELGESSQKYLDVIRQDDDAAFSETTCAAVYKNDWQCDATVKTRVCRTLIGASKKNPGMTFVAADTRHSGEGAEAVMTQNLSVWQKTRFSMGMIPMVAHYTLYNCISAYSLFPLAIFLGKDGIDTVLNNLKDDRNTSALVQLHGGGVLFYGAGHFRVEKEKANENSMRILLQEHGKTMCVMDVCVDEKQYQEVKGNTEGSIPPDVVLLVHPSKTYPDGVIILNPEYQPMLDAARDINRPAPMALNRARLLGRHI